MSQPTGSLMSGGSQPSKSDAAPKDDTPLSPTDMPTAGLEVTYRGDTRDPKALEDSGGFIPIYLLQDHPDGGLKGFIDCKNKTNGVMGCSCSGFSEAELFNRARERFREMLTEHPSEPQDHVMFNRVGLLATARKKDEAYGGYQYKMESHFTTVFKYPKAQDVLHEPVKREFLERQNLGNLAVLLNADCIDKATILAVKPKGEVEVTYYSPIPYKGLAPVCFVSHTGAEIGLNEPSKIAQSQAEARALRGQGPVAPAAAAIGSSSAPLAPPPPAPPPPLAPLSGRKPIVKS